MALVEDLVKGNVALLAATGAAALVLPRVFPYLSPPVRSAVKSGLKLFMEAEGEAEGGIVNRLVEATVNQMLETLSGPGTKEEKQEAARQAVEQFQAVARDRADRYGWSEEDRAARYRHATRRLRHAITEAKRHRPRGHAEILSDAASAVSEDW